MTKKTPDDAWEKIPDIRTLNYVESSGPRRRKYCAARAKDALITAFGEDEGPRCSVIDALADLRHLCDSVGLDFAELDRMAYMHYSEECRPEKK